MCIVYKGVSILLTLNFSYNVGDFHAQRARKNQTPMLLGYPKILEGLEPTSEKTSLTGKRPTTCGTFKQDVISTVGFIPTHFGVLSSRHNLHLPPLKEKRELS